MALEKATITNTNSGDRITVQFNPEEYTVNRDVNYAQAAIPGLAAPLLQFAHGNMQTLELELLVDTYEAHAGTAAGADARDVVRRITALMDIDPATHAPPVLLFTWASLSFTCVLARASQRFIMFRPDGAPVRARLQVTFNEFRNADLEAKEVKRETADYSRRHVVGQSESLSGLAGRAYEDPSAWRPIAIRNGVDDPRRLGVGRSLLIPQLPFVDPETGEVTR
ncbi:MAG: peptigoglycan-binding protein LysM [Longimicrobiales bacterium]